MTNAVDNCNMTFREVELNREIESYLIDLVLSEGSSHATVSLAARKKRPSGKTKLCINIIRYITCKLR